jgi:EmrB/QacA subfamily drug resistance transporter
VSEPEEPDPRRWRALTVCLVAGFMTLLDVSIVNVALPSIRDGLGASQSDLQLVLSGYALAFGLALVPAGRTGDARGRRRTFLVGLGLFTLASAACGLAPAPGWLVAARLLQGVGGGVLTPQVSALIQQLFRGAERGRAFGLLGGSIGLSTAVGPLLGGLILVTVPGQGAWRWVFLVNLPVGLLALVLARRLIPPDARAGHRERLDPVGIALLAAGLTSLLLPLLAGRDLPRLVSGALLVGAVAFLALFVGWERRFAARGGRPVVDLALLRTGPYAAGVVVGLVYFAGFTSIFFVLTLFLQSGLGYSPFEAGLAQTPFAIGGAVAAPLAGRSVHRYGRPLVVTGLALTGAALAAAWVVVETFGARGDAGVLGLALALPLLAGGIGSGMVISPNTTLTLAEAPVHGAGSAGGVLQTAQRVGSALGIAVVGAVFFAVLGDGGGAGSGGAGSGADGAWQRAFAAGLGVSVAFVVLALAPAVWDLRRRRAGDPH